MRVPFTLPRARELPSRLGFVLAAIYAAYTNGWEGVTGSDGPNQGLATEAIWLARLCIQLMPKEPEARGLLALMLYCESRRQARRTLTGQYVPLSEQNTALWSRPMIEEAEQALRQAATHQQMGRFQLEAAIQSVHAQRVVTEHTDWDSLAQLYAGLIQLSPTVGARLGYAAAIASAQGPEQGLRLLADLPADTVINYQPYWALKAHLLQQWGDQSLAQQAYARAMGLTEDPAVREFLMQRSRQSSNILD